MSAFNIQKNHTYREHGRDLYLDPLQPCLCEMGS